MIEQAANQGFETLDQIRWDLWMAAAAIGLLFFGVVMVYSASGGERDTEQYLITQVQWAGLALLAMAVLMRVDYHFYSRPAFVYGFFLVCVVLLIAVFFSPARNGAHRWIIIRQRSWGQPSELAKMALVVFLAWFLNQRHGQ